MEWQQVVVIAVVILAGAMAFYMGISSWRSIRAGACGRCAGCGGSDTEPVGERPKNREAFIPADTLRNSKRT